MLVCVRVLWVPAPVAAEETPGWKHRGVVTVLTTPDGADLKDGAVVEEFPVLVRLNRDFLDFSEAKAGGEDVRFSSGGKSLAYQIDEWDAEKGVAGIWVRVPKIRGNERQEIGVHWGNAAAVSGSNGKAVFDETNGYASVWHLGADLVDEVGTLESENVGTTEVPGMVGLARHFAGNQGVFCGDKIANYPAGGSSHTTEVWFRAEQAGSTIIGWGNEGGGRGTKVRMQLRSPPHVHVDSGFSDIDAPGILPLNEWIHVVHTYGDGPRRLYINGEVAGEAATVLDFKSPMRLYLGGWYNNYDFVGDLDEVRISRVARSADWVRLSYENQKMMQTLVGPLVKAGNAFGVSEPRLVVEEGKGATVTARADGAQKIYWILKRAGGEQVVAVDRLSYQFDAGRVIGDEEATLVFKAVYPKEVKTREIPISVKEGIADPVFTLAAPQVWDGRTTIEVVPQVANLREIEAKGAGNLKIDWKVDGVAVIKDAVPGKLRLERAMNSGTMTVTATLSNGGKSVMTSVRMAVIEPEIDPWVMRTPGKDEQPEEGQFYARDDKGEGTLFYNGTLEEDADSVFLKVWADDKAFKKTEMKLSTDKSYGLSVRLKPGLIRYRVEFGFKKGGRETVVRTVGDIVCGDAYIIEGQSNALATDTREESPPVTSEWIRSYGQAPKDPAGNGWCRPVWKARKGEKAELGWWGMELAKRLVESQQVPILIINGAVGGTRIDQHQRNGADPTDLSTIYGRMLWRVRQAKLSHGIRGIIWHQGESNQGADSPTGDYDWKSYEDYFVEMSAGWKRDFPNLQRLYVFQIWPDSCSMAGDTGAGDRIREIQRSLPRLYSNMSVMSTLGIKPPGGCHFPLEGWSEFARLIEPLIARDFYGLKPSGPITPPNLLKVSYGGPAKESILLEFDQAINWDDGLAGQFYLDGEKNKVMSGTLRGNVLVLKLREASDAGTITYLKESDWSQDKLLIGTNGIAALSFCQVPILESSGR